LERSLPLSTRVLTEELRQEVADARHAGEVELVSRRSRSGEGGVDGVGQGVRGEGVRV
jgi:hypothetical protein